LYAVGPAALALVLLSSAQSVPSRRTANEWEAEAGARFSASESEQAQGNGEEMLRRIAKSMGHYARDISEIPLQVETKVSKTDTGGREKRSESSTHSMQFIRRSYGDGQFTRHLQAHKAGLHRVSKDELNADSAVGVLALMFDNGAASNTRAYDITEHAKSKRLELKIVDTGPCEGFDPNEVRERKWCGEAQLFLDRDTLEPLSASVTAGGFPFTAGKVRYKSFHFDEQFQSVNVGGSKEPFLLPAKVVVTYETDNERTVIEGKYAVKGKGGARK
jgi:hypothetical protein